MQNDALSSPVSTGARWAGWILTVLTGAFMLLDGGMKLAKPEFVVKATVEMGYPESSIGSSPRCSICIRGPQCWVRSC